MFNPPTYAPIRQAMRDNTTLTDYGDHSICADCTHVLERCTTETITTLQNGYVTVKWCSMFEQCDSIKTMETS